MSDFKFRFLCSFFVSLLPLLNGCTPDNAIKHKKSIVVEGWIETDKPPIVLVSTTFSLDDMSDFVGTWAKVTVSDGQNECVLTGKRDDRYLPPYLYTTTEMRGVTGKTYKLTVEYDGKTVYAETTLPPPPPAPDSLFLEKSAFNDTLFSIVARFYDDGLFNHRVRTMVYGEDDIPQSSLLGTIKKSNTPQKVQCVVDRNYSTETKKVKYFCPGDKVVMYLSSIDDFSYDFWLKYENLRVTRMMMSLFETELPSNIVGGKGYWFAYGTNTTRLLIGDTAEDVIILK